MAKRNTGWTEKKIERYIKEGRGQGEGADYQPWLTIQDVPSIGLVTRTKGWKSNRIHHFMSQLEMHYFYLVEWSDVVEDIREQFPLYRDDTYQIAQEKGIRHPTDPSTSTPIVMTTDFFLTINEKGTRKHVARTIKPSSELENSRTIEKLEIEREYWSLRGIDWGIVTEQQLHAEFIQNIEWVHSFYYPDEAISEAAYEHYILELKDLLNIQDATVIELLTHFDCEMNLSKGTGLNIFKHLVARKEISIEMKSLFQTHSIVRDCILNIKMEEGIERAVR